MADDAQFDPLAGILTPQALQLMRAQAQQKMMMDAGAPGISGRDFGARVAGMSLGQGLAQFGQQAAPQGGGQPGQPDQSTGGSPPAMSPGNSVMDQVANQNQQILGQPSTAQPTGNPFEDRAQWFEGKARAFMQAGNYQVAQQLFNNAQIVRKQGLDAGKTQADTYEALGKGQDSQAKVWTEPKAGMNPATGQLDYFQRNPLTNETRWGAQAPPQVPQASITMNTESPFVKQFADQLGTYSTQADSAANSLGLIKDMRNKLASGVITGSGADQRTAIGNALTTLGYKGSEDAVANTQAYTQEALAMALQNRPVGQRLTQTEWNALKGMAAGDNNDIQAGLEATLKVRQMIAEQSIQNYNKQAAVVGTLAKNSKSPVDRASYSQIRTMYPDKDVPDSQVDVLPTLTPAQVAALPSGKGTRFKTTDGRTGIKP
jgi:hypothetical protein